MTLPRELRIVHIGNEMYVASQPVSELKKIEQKPVSLKNVSVSNSLDLSKIIKKDIAIPLRLNLELNEVESFSLTLSNDLGEKLVVGYDKGLKQYFIDRTHSGKTDFQKDFAARHVAPRLIDHQKMDLSIIVDESSIELFADGGLSVMTSIFFPGKPYNHLEIENGKNLVFRKFEYIGMQSIWR